MAGGVWCNSKVVNTERLLLLPFSFDFLSFFSFFF